MHLNGTRAFPPKNPGDNRYKGWVTLKGELEWQYQKQEAERVIRRLWGVKGVEQSDHSEAAGLAQ